MSDHWRNRPVLVTGAGGFIGSHLAEKLVALGASVRALVHYNSMNNCGWLEGASGSTDSRMEIVAGDVRDRDSVQAAMKGIDTVFHLAALIGIPYSYVAPDSYVKTNVEGTLNVLQAARAAGARRVVHTSTSEVYGSAQYVPIDEKHPLSAQSPYAASKIAADQMASSFFSSFGLEVAIIRPFNTYGPRQSARAIVPTIITQLLDGGGAKEIQLGSLQPTRDLTFVEDMADAFIATAVSDAAVGQVTNIGSGAEISIGDLFERIRGLLGSSARVRTAAERVRPGTSEVERLCADTRRALGTVDWKPRVGLDEGLRRTIEWLRPNLGSYKIDRYNI